MYNRIAVILLLNLIMSNSILCWPQHHNSPYPSYGFRVTYNDQMRRLPQYMRSWFEDRNLLKRNSDFNQRSQEEFAHHGSPKILNTRSTSREQPDIVFPDAAVSDYEMPNIPILGDKSPCGDGKPFCERVDTYPVEVIDNILKNSAVNIADYFPKDDFPIEVGERFNSPNEENLCNSKREIIKPQSAENKDGQWLFIVNHDNYSQEIHTEICEGKEEKCKFASFPIGYESFCKQHFVYRKLYALEQGSQRVVKDTFKLPSCCTCVVRNVGVIANRSSFPMSSKESSFNKKSTPNRRVRRHTKP